MSTGRAALLRITGGLYLLVSCLVIAGEAAGQQMREPGALNVSIQAFEPGVPADRGLHRDLEIFPRIRAIEARILPFLLREEMVESGKWGAVRVVPETDDAAELLVLGRIEHSDGEVVAIRVRAIDASGRAWLDERFEGDAAADYSETGPGPMYSAINTALLAARGRLDDTALARIVEVSMMRYAASLAPTAFSPYLARDEDGRYRLARLPSRDDPMLARINRLRGMEYVITDAIDAKYRELNDEVTAVYDLWRAYRRKSLEYRAEDARYARSSVDDAEPGSYETLQALYDSYKWSRLTAQELDDLAVAFSNEVEPLVKNVEERIVELNSWADERYGEWNRILEELFEVESLIGPTGPSPSG